MVNRTAGRIASAIALSLPLAGLGLLLGVPRLDLRWEHQPSHFWLVLVAAAINGALAYATGDAARTRGDARIFLVSLAFLSAAGFLLLHALATPGVVVPGSNAGFVIATPVGLVTASLFMAWSAVPAVERGGVALRSLSRLRVVLLVVMAAWGLVSLLNLAPLNGPPPLQRGSGAMLALATVAGVCYAGAAIGYLRLMRERSSRLLASVAMSCILLAEAMVAVAVSRNWHASWWEWHVLMLVAFAVVGWTARRQWRQEPFSDLYLRRTAAGTREISVMFADLTGFTTFSEHRTPEDVSRMLNAYFEVAVPIVVERHGGRIDQIVGDAILATFNAQDDQADHAARAARAALDLCEASRAVVREHPDWPLLRIGVNTGSAVVGVVGAEGGRTYTVIGDAVNLAARLQQSAPPGGVVIGGATLRAVSGAVVESLGTLSVKGKSDPVEAYLLTALGAVTPSAEEGSAT